MRRTPSSDDPLLVAHRAGNHISSMRDACASGVDLTEADVHFHRGRLEVRHFKTMGPIPVLWDRWGLARGWTPRLQLEELLTAAPDSCELMLDLKGRRPGFAPAVLRVIQATMPNRCYTVCSQMWESLVPFHDDPFARIVHSVGSAAALRRVKPMLLDERRDAISIHKKLLTAEVIRDLLQRVNLIMTWPANTEAEVRNLQQLGVNGFTIDNRELLRALASERHGG